ncbi:hypothetical protein F0L17_22710 [Streptomyces sp. TRM43335]|uniref:Uncharacterized protein n=1 Tax=Streptomyces taklimakanensis TaxID=2569853 RepID=A0A6G2BI37_9ACTN|nr:hypothetical protein [Streptomyces taklimakanensis]MTE21874.1 hypothetical protein [Streptomyces taklimakanensis]
MSRGEIPEGSGTPERQRPAASASGTGGAKASDGGTAVSGTVFRSSISSTAIGHQYTLLWEWAAGWSVLPVAVGSITAVALARKPEGRTSQFVLPYTLMAATVLAAVLLAVLAGEWGGRGRAAERPTRKGTGPSLGIRVAMVVMCLAAALSGLLWMEYLREHGEVDVTRRVVLENHSGVGDGKSATLILDGRPERDHLRVTVSVEDENPAAGACARGTEIDVALEGEPLRGANKALVDGETAELELGGGNEVRVRLTVHTVSGCHVELGVTDVFLYG